MEYVDCITIHLYNNSFHWDMSHLYLLSAMFINVHMECVTPINQLLVLLRQWEGDATCEKYGVNFERHVNKPKKHWRSSLLAVDGMFFTARVFLNLFSALGLLEYLQDKLFVVFLNCRLLLLNFI